MGIWMKFAGGIIIILCLCIGGVDFFFFLKNRYCRFHIGRWSDDEKWKEAVYLVALKWIKHTPTVKKTDSSRYILLDMWNGNYRNQTIQSWQNAALILGLWGKNAEAAQNAAKSFLDEKGFWKRSPKAVDGAMLAYAILKVTDNPIECKPAMDYMVKLIQENMDEQGLISYTGGKSNTVRYVDTLGLVCPFLACYARVYDASELLSVAYQQLRFYRTYGLYEGTMLPNHAIDSKSLLPLGVYGWGRGVAWYVIGLTDTYAECPVGKMKEDIKVWIDECAKKYVAFQQADGGFGSTFQRKNTYDSSATAVMADFYMQCVEILENKEYVLVADKCLEKLKKVTRITGKIDWCQGDTKDIGVFAQTYDIMPFAQGETLRAINRKIEE